MATGTGDLAVALSARGAEVVGLDFSERMLELARAKAPDVRFEAGNALALPYGDGEFDAVTVGFGAMVECRFGSTATPFKRESFLM